MKKKTKNISVIVPILNDTYKVYVYIGERMWANKQISSYLKEKREWIEPMNRGRSVYRVGYHPCIWIDSTSDYQSAIGTISHEAVHAISHIMGYLAMDAFDISGNEFLGHSVGAIVRCCLGKIRFNKDN